MSLNTFGAHPTYGADGLIDRLPGARGPHSNQVSSGGVREAGMASVRYENLYESIRISPDVIWNGRADTDERTSVADSLARDRVIAHAGGGIDGNKITNFLEALDLS